MSTTVAFGGEMSKVHYLLYTLNLVVGCFGISIILPFIIMYGMDHRFAVSEDLSILFLFIHSSIYWFYSLSAIMVYPF